MALQISGTSIHTRTPLCVALLQRVVRATGIQKCTRLPSSLPSVSRRHGIDSRIWSCSGRIHSLSDSSIHQSISILLPSFLPSFLNPGSCMIEQYTCGGNGGGGAACVNNGWREILRRPLSEQANVRALAAAGVAAFSPGRD